MHFAGDEQVKFAYLFSLMPLFSSMPLIDILVESNHLMKNMLMMNNDVYGGAVEHGSEIDHENGHEICNGVDETQMSCPMSNDGDVIGGVSDNVNGNAELAIRRKNMMRKMK